MCVVFHLIFHVPPFLWLYFPSKVCSEVSVLLIHATMNLHLFRLLFCFLLKVCILFSQLYLTYSTFQYTMIQSISSFEIFYVFCQLKFFFKLFLFIYLLFLYSWTSRFTAFKKLCETEVIKALNTGVHLSMESKEVLQGLLATARSLWTGISTKTCKSERYHVWFLAILRQSIFQCHSVDDS